MVRKQCGQNLGSCVTTSLLSVSAAPVSLMHQTVKCGHNTVFHHRCSSLLRTSLAISESLQESNDGVLFGGEQLQGRGYPTEGLCHPHLPPLAPLLSGVEPAAGHSILVGLLLLPLQRLLERAGAPLLLVSCLVLSLASRRGCGR